MSYAYPRMPDRGARLKAMLGAYRAAGGKDACLLVHDSREGRKSVLELGRRRGLPARVIPYESFHVASTGIDFLLAAIAHGASQVRVLITEAVDEAYVAALEKQMGYAQAVLAALGYGGAHFGLLRDPSAVWGLAAAGSVAKPATFNFSPDKRTTLDFAISHLAAQASTPKEEIPLASGAPFGALSVNRDSCTLCKACIGACPESALLDSPEVPRLRFIERNCVQCGLCASTCPEQAITLVPRLSLSDKAREPVTLNEAEPFSCVRCGKPFGTRQMVQAMLGRLAGHAMFEGAGALKRLQMCGDCRVVDMMENRSEATIFEVPK
jgi:ferredoxin